jgi:transposase
LRLSTQQGHGRPLVRFEGSDSATALVGMAGFVLVGAVEVDGELWQLIETTARAWCRACGCRAVSKGRRTVKVRDLPAGGRPVVIGWRKRIWRCPATECEVKTWTEQHDAIGARRSLTERARRETCRRVGRNHSVAEVARELGVGWATVMAAVVDYGTPLVEDPDRIGTVQQLGLDEAKYQKAGPRRRTRYATGFVDLDRGQLLDVVPGRTAAAVHDWLTARPVDWLRAVATVAIDPHQGYANGVKTRLSHATLVVDPFHAVKLANAAIDDVRRRVQQETLGHRGHKDDPLYGIRRLLLQARETLSDKGRARLEAGLKAGDPRDEVLDAWLAKESLRDFYAAASPAEAVRLFDDFLAECRSSRVPEQHRLGRTMTKWSKEILAHHTTGASNGPTEAVNLLIKKVQRVAHGFRNFDNYRLRLLLMCGNVKWQTQPTARIRGRAPRLAA